MSSFGTIDSEADLINVAPADCNRSPWRRTVGIDVRAHFYNDHSFQRSGGAGSNLSWSQKKKGLLITSMRQPTPITKHQNIWTKIFISVGKSPKARRFFDQHRSKHRTAPHFIVFAIRMLHQWMEPWHSTIRSGQSLTFEIDRQHWRC